MLEPQLVPYYQDVYDHALRTAEWSDSLRELVGNVREAHMNQQGFKLNDIMKKITSWAAIIAVPTLITGFYGQNVPYPGAEHSIGFWTSTILIVMGTVLALPSVQEAELALIQAPPVHKFPDALTEVTVPLKPR